MNAWSNRISFSRPYGWFSIRIRRSSLTTSRSFLNVLSSMRSVAMRSRFHPQHQRQVLRRHRLPVHRRVFGRVGVGLAADRRHDRRVLLGLDVLRALEHHVLEQVREAGAARRARPSSRRDTRAARARSASSDPGAGSPSARWAARAAGSRASAAAPRHRRPPATATIERPAAQQHDAARPIEMAADFMKVCRLCTGIFDTCCGTRSTCGTLSAPVSCFKRGQPCAPGRRAACASPAGAGPRRRPCATRGCPCADSR